MINTSFPSTCDECGRKVAKLTRVYRGHGYCATCYARVFKTRPCSKCHVLARLHKKEANAICRRCEHMQPCVRCGKFNRPVGKITPYGPVCNACAVHFREARPCPLCGRSCRRLSRLSRLGSDLQIAEAATLPDRSWRSKIFGADAEEPLADLLPVTSAQGLAALSEDADDWLPRFKRLTGIDPLKKLKPIDLGLQLYRERLILRALKG